MVLPPLPATGSGAAFMTEKIIKIPLAFRERLGRMAADKFDVNNIHSRNSEVAAWPGPSIIAQAVSSKPFHRAVTSGFWGG